MLPFQCSINNNQSILSALFTTRLQKLKSNLLNLTYTLLFITLLWNSPIFPNLITIHWHVHANRYLTSSVPSISIPKVSNAVSVESSHLYLQIIQNTFNQGSYLMNLCHQIPHFSLKPHQLKKSIVKIIFSL